LLTSASTTVLRFGDRRVPRVLADLVAVDVHGPESMADRIDTATESARRVIVVGTDADLATVLTRLLRTDRLDVAVAQVRGRFGARQAVTGAAQRIPLIRDETGTVVVGAACWLPADGSRTIRGEAVVDDTVLFDGQTTEIQVEPLPTMPGVRARIRGGRWATGRAVQLGTTGAVVVRDGVAAPRPVRRSTFYRHTQGWLRVG
jgi:hypothetical protein